MDWIIDLHFPWTIKIVYPILIGLEVTSYQIFSVVGILVYYFLLKRLLQKSNLLINEDYDLFFGLGLVSTYSTSGIFTLLYNAIRSQPNFHLDHIKQYGGYTSLAGIIGLSLFVIGFSYTKDRFKSFSQIADRVAIAGSFSMGIGRLGCFTTGCCYGKESTCFITVVYKEEFYAPTETNLIPIQLYEAIALFVIGYILLYLYKKSKPYIFTVFFVTYSLWRFAIEFYRGESEHFITFYSINVYQLICLVFLFSSITYYFYTRSNQNGHKKHV